MQNGKVLSSRLARFNRKMSFHFTAVSPCRYRMFTRESLKQVLLDFEETVHSFPSIIVY